MMRRKNFFALGLAAMALIAGGCSKTESVPPAQTAPAKPEMSLPAPPAEAKQPTSVKSDILSPHALFAAKEAASAKLAVEVMRLEAVYYADPKKRAEIIDNLDEMNSPHAIEAITRLFLGEKDIQLKILMIDALSNMEGYDDQRLAFFGMAMHPDQMTEVRLRAIESLGDEEDPRMIQLLQGLVNDIDEIINIRQAAMHALGESEGMQEETDLPEEESQLEAAYINTQDVTKRGAIIQKFSLEIPAADAIDAFARMFFNEQDPLLRLEMVDSLTLIDGETDKKLAILTAAVHDDESMEISIPAIDALANVYDERAILVLLDLLKDPDGQIRAIAKSALDRLQLFAAPKLSPPGR